MTTPWWQLGWVWAGTGWVLLALGAWLLVWALFRDRARGRLRCPGCWYDMAGTPSREEGGVPTWVCPECGRKIASARALARTRRRWGRAGLAALLLLLGYGSIQFIAIRDGGWVRAVPTTLLVFVGPTEYLGLSNASMAGGLVPAGLTPAQLARVRGGMTLGGGPGFAGMAGPPLTWRQQLGEEAWRRVHSGGMWRWQSQRFVERAIAGTTIDLPSVVCVPTRWLAGEAIPVMIVNQQRPTPWGLLMTSRAKSPMAPQQSYPDVYDVIGGAAGTTSDVRVELALWSGTTEVYSVLVRRSVAMVPDAAAMFRLDGSEETTARVRSAFDVRLFLPHEGGGSVVLDNRSDSADWSELRLGLGSVLTLRIDGEIAGRGAHWPEWSRAVFKDWEEIQIDWAPGMLERVRPEPGRVRVEVRGDPVESLRVYRAWPFADTDPGCWTGMFEVTPRVVERPERVRELHK